ncbi:MAG: transcription elongation factor GreB [Micavibrio aeruginosavorus]|uniref:Transcription elongation factor GreB n=1 Tax=Micavibrio aeruginosavorus TaxID=349221 RepID=A0A7T5R1H2_9BACT|nr:MAG: transcription elongation factor GreB [Micavibrio aeruginosavorus]
MSKAFTKENDNDADDDLDEPDPLPTHVKNLMTPAGHEALQTELKWLLREERPRIVEIVSWAAGNGDRSENGDYLYNKKRLREIDRRIRYLTKRLDDVEIVDPRKQQGLEQVFFGATVTYVHEDEREVTVKLVGVDEADLDEGKINWLSPVAKALMKARIGDCVELRLSGGIEVIEVVEIVYHLKE